MRAGRSILLGLVMAGWASTVAAQTISSAANQTFVVGAASTTISPITINAGGVKIKKADDIRIMIPAAFNMTWDVSVTTATITGSGAGSVSTAVTYEAANKTVVIDVTSNFSGAEQLVVSGLKFMSFTAPSVASNLGLNVAGVGLPAAVNDNRTIAIIAPTLTSSASQTFTVGDAATAMTSATITDNGTTATITAANDIRVRVPAGFNMVWNTALPTATIGGGAAGKVSPTVSYENAGQVLVLNVTSNFAAGDQVTVSGLQFTSFTTVSAAANLQLVISGSPGGPTVVADNTTKTIVAPTISSAANQIFVVGQAPAVMNTITVTDAGTPTITVAGNIRIRIPATLNLTWNTSLTTATIGGASAAKVATTVSYESGGKILVLDVTSAFAGGNQITVSGLQFSSFTAASAATSLELVVSGSPAGGTAAIDNRTKAIVAPTISSAASQTFVVGQASTSMSAITVTDAGTATITATNNIRIRIPTGSNMIWNTAITTATIGGAAAVKVLPIVTYEDAGKTLVLDVILSFAANDQITVSGLQFTSFTAPSSATSLELVISGAGGTTTATDDKTKTIVAPTLAETANQFFTVGDPSTVMTTATVTDATTPTITAASDIRLRIPAGFGMTWNTALTSATIGGGAAARVSGTVSYENGGQVLVLNVTSNFGSSDQITIAGLQFTNFTGVSAASPLQLVVSGAGGTAVATSNRTKEVVAPTISSAANQTFVIADPATGMSPVVITDNAIAPSVKAANNIRVRIPVAANLTWNTSLTTATIGGGAAARVSTTVSYEDAGKTLLLDVTSDFGASDQITVSGLEFANFTASSPAASLELIISGPAGSTAATDTRTKTVAGGTISSAANQTFVVGQASTVMSLITVTDASTPTITAARDIRLRIPTGFNMSWNTSITTATIGGISAASVSTTVGYEDGGRIVVLNVTSDFLAGSQIILSGLQFDNFTAASAAGELELVESGSPTGGAADLDNMTKTIVAPTISSGANQTFVGGQPTTAISPITVTDALTPAITAAGDVRIRIPTGFAMTWNTALTTATIGGGAAAKVSSSVTYENSGQVLVLNVTSNFAASDQITVSGLQFTNFTALSPTNYVQLVVTGPGGGTSATDDKTITIITAGATIAPHLALLGRLPSNGVVYTATGTLQNTGSQTDSYDLLASQRPGTAVSLVSMSGTGVTQGSDPDSARVSNLGSGVAGSVTISFSVGDVAAGVMDTLVIIARSATLPTVRDSVKLAIRVVRPSLAFSKAVNPSGTQAPGTDLTYTTTVTNVGSQSAFSVIFVDSLPGSVQFNVGSVVNTFPVPVTMDYSNDGGTSWTYLPASGACGAPAGFDGCVNRIRWTLGGSLSPISPVNTGTAAFISRIR